MTPGGSSKEPGRLDSPHEGAPRDAGERNEFLHRLIENAFSWALQDCNYLNPKYMDRLIAETRRGMTPEQAAEWNATAMEQAARGRRGVSGND